MVNTSSLLLGFPGVPACDERVEIERRRRTALLAGNQGLAQCASDEITGRAVAAGCHAVDGTNHWYSIACSTAPLTRRVWRLLGTAELGKGWRR